MYSKMTSLFTVLLILFMVTSCEKKQEKVSQAMTEQTTLPDFDSLWQFHLPVETREKFKEILPLAEKEKDRTYHFQLLTQIARTYSLESDFESAHNILDMVEQNMSDDMHLVNVRYLLERGRSYRSNSQVDLAIPLFQKAYQLSDSIKADFFTVDAAHMMAISVTEFKDRMDWNLKALAIAEKSKVEKAQNWKGSLYNNIGWDYHDNKEYDKALNMFQDALAFRETQGDKRTINIARWCIARCLRSLEKYDDALKIQQELYTDMESGVTSDGYVFEELGELYLIKGEPEKSKENFARAYELLSADTWMMENESARMARMKKLSE